METIDEQLVVRFLLGQLSESDRLRLEERLFVDDRFYEQILAIQEELADDYIQDKLPVIQRARFERHFLRSSRRRERVVFAAALSSALARPEPRAAAAPSRVWWEPLLAFIRPRLGLATSAAALALLIGAAWLFLENRRLSGRVEQARGESDSLIERSRINQSEAERKEQELQREIAALRAQGGEMEAQIQQKQRELEALQRARRLPKSEQSASAIATFVLSPGLTRGTDEPEKLTISPGARLIQLQLDLEREENYQSYVAEIRTARGNLAWSKSGLAMQRTTYGQAVSLTIPANLLFIGEYEVTLKGAAKGKVEAVGYYYFIALKR